MRISGNKIRFRLKEPEVEKFKQTGIVTEALQFGPDDNEQVKFTLRREEANQIGVSFNRNETTILVPGVKAQEWTSTELVGFNADVDTGKTISILVEKDFMCMDSREEDNESSYSNPLAIANA